MKKISVIVNPISGTISKDNISKLINRLLHPQTFQTEIFYTQCAGHASVLTQQALNKGVDYIVAAGGDGTVNEVARAMVHTSATLGIIPVGSGNGLARDLGIPMDIKKAIELIAQAQYTQVIDYCKANEHIFFCTCGVGFDAVVSEKFSESKKRGSISYAKSAIAEYLKFKPDVYEITLDEGTTLKEEAFLITCANASQYGNNAYIAPDANNRDGLMDIVIVAPINPLDVGPLTIQLFTKQIINNQRVSYYRSSKVTIKRNHPGPMHVDGESLHAGTEILLKTIPAGLRVIAPLKTNKQRTLQNQLENIHLFFREIFND
ncbi:MAG: diacylglycerol kinase family lipid kinase [Dysgonamonadaceae bacterium]|jgi:YegS/Rv2252/BmrU family lipid kinase|nr:diacylglycerol kinase family lipid kinase [Dysgonamonadaceae bacterium]